MLDMNVFCPIVMNMILDYYESTLDICVCYHRFILCDSYSLNSLRIHTSFLVAWQAYSTSIVDSASVGCHCYSNLQL
jgi:fatty-acid desaturase